MSESTEIVTIQWGNKYEWDYVDHLARAVREHSSHELLVFTDRKPPGLDIDARVWMLPVNPAPVPISGWWWKLWLFSQQARTVIGLQKDLLWLDLDTVLVGDLDRVIKRVRDFRSFVTLSSPLPPSRLGSGVMWIPREMSFTIWRRWVEKGCEQRSPLGDQGWIQECVEKGAERQTHATWQELFPDEFLSYKCDVLKGQPWDNATLVYFHGTPRPHQVPPDDPISRIWRGCA